MNSFYTTLFASALAGVASGGDLADYVDPFVGTSSTGHTTPAAALPFGLVQAGPDTGNDGWEYCSGYRYDDTSVCGFSQTHLNGTGCPDLGDLLLLPAVSDDAGPQPFDKKSEKAQPGYYAVTLDCGVRVEIAAAEHSAIYRFTYGGTGPSAARTQPAGGKISAKLLIDTQWGLGGNMNGHILESEVGEITSAGFSGTNRRRSWVERSYSYAVAFSRPSTAWRELPKRDAKEKAPRLVFDFDMESGEALVVKVALSRGTASAAASNLAKEIPAWDFEEVRRKARAKWNDVLATAVVEGTEEQKRNWYTALYHLFFQPNNVADAGERPFYSTLSTWDTFRAAGPLYTILVPDKAAEFVDSMLAQGRKTGYLPIWTLWGEENQCMIGTHSIPMIVDWFLKTENGKGKMENGGYWLAAYAQIKETLTKPHPGRHKENWGLYDRYGYYPFDKIRGESVSRTLECAYDDWCAAQMAAALGMDGDRAFFTKRSENWRNVFDTTRRLVRGRDTRGGWRTPFDPFALGHGADLDNDFTEGNSYQYTWHVMQNPEGLIEALGGRGVAAERLEGLFTLPSRIDGEGFVGDVSGLVGQYAHGNEPSHHTIYFFQYAGRPDLTAKYVREVFDRFYLPKPDGLCGNDDCGQMSAWYLFSAMGFYPFNPCGGEYVLGAPQVPKATLSLKNGRKFTIVAKGLSKENRYVKSVALNGKPLTGFILKHSDIVSGGELVFEMTR